LKTTGEASQPDETNYIQETPVKKNKINKGGNNTVYPTKQDKRGVIIHVANTQIMNEFKGAAFHILSDLHLLYLKLR